MAATFQWYACAAPFNSGFSVLSLANESLQHSNRGLTKPIYQYTRFLFFKSFFSLLCLEVFSFPKCTLAFFSTQIQYLFIGLSVVENNRLIPYSKATQFHENEYNLLRNVCNIHTKSHSKKINSDPIAKSTAAHLLYIETVYKVDMQAHSRFHFCQFYNSIIQLAWYFGNITSAIFQFPPHKYISLSYLCHSSLFVD